MKSKGKHHSEKLLEFQDDAKKIWRIMKEVIGKSKLINLTLPRKIATCRIAYVFNNFFITLGPNGYKPMTFQRLQVLSKATSKETNETIKTMS